MAVSSWRLLLGLNNRAKAERDYFPVRGDWEGFPSLSSLDTRTDFSPSPLFISSWRNFLLKQSSDSSLFFALFIARHFRFRSSSACHSPFPLILDPPELPKLAHRVPSTYPLLCVCLSLELPHGPRVTSHDLRSRCRACELREGFVFVRSSNRCHTLCTLSLGVDGLGPNCHCRPTGE